MTVWDTEQIAEVFAGPRDARVWPSFEGYVSELNGFLLAGANDCKRMALTWFEHHAANGTPNFASLATTPLR